MGVLKPCNLSHELRGWKINIKQIKSKRAKRVIVGGADGEDCRVVVVGYREH